MDERLQLQKTDHEEYELCKQVINDGLAICYVVGNACRIIKEKQYFRADGYESYEAFCDGEYGWSKRYCNQLILDAKTINSLPESMRKLIISHNAAREISKCPPMLREAVINIATDNGKKPATAPNIKAATPKPSPRPKKSTPAPTPKSKPSPAKKAASATAKAQPAGPVDATGLPVPSESLTLWKRGGEAQELLTYISSTRSRLKKYQEAKDPLFAEVDFTNALALLQQVFADVRLAIPHAVCPTCQGKVPKDCAPCKGRGFVSEFYWEKCVPAEIRQLRCSK